MSIISRIIGYFLGSIFYDLIGKPIKRSVQQRWENTDQRLRSDSVVKRFSNRAKLISGILIHLIVFAVVTIIFNSFTDDNRYSSGNIDLFYFGWFWVLCLIIPHGMTVLVLVLRWSDMEVKPVVKEKKREKPKPKVKRKRKSRFNLNFSKDWDE